METNPSLWVATAPGTNYPALDHDIEADVIVVGSGITGLTTARLLAGRGLSVVVIEARRLCYGTTGFTTAKVTALHSTIYSELAERWGDETAPVLRLGQSGGGRQGQGAGRQPMGSSATCGRPRPTPTPR